MKSLKYLGIVLLMGAGLAACSEEWDDHFDEASLSRTQSVDIYAGTVSQYLAAHQADLSKMTAAYKAAGLQSVLSGGQCTAIVTDDNNISGSIDSLAACNLLSDVAFEPASVEVGRGIYMLSGKNLWVTADAQGKMLNEQRITKVVKTDNGYVYHVGGLISVEPSIYQYIQSLGDDYSLFKQFIAEFEQTYFDEAASTPSGEVDAMGNIIYEKEVYATRNTLMDRYTADGVPTWDMRSEAYQSTVFIPTNALLQKAYYDALDSIPVWMNRTATAADSLKFRKWLVAACFVGHRLSADEVASNVDSLIECVGDYVQEINETTDSRTYSECEAALWKPSVQLVDAAGGITLSNGVAYNVQSLRIPNHIVIWRAKTRFYNVWGNLLDDKAYWRGWDFTSQAAIDSGKFVWENCYPLADALQVNSAFTLHESLPTIIYNCVVGVPTASAIENKDLCAVEFEGLNFCEVAGDARYGSLVEATLPAGEYYLRLGGKHRLNYTINVYFASGDEEFSSDNLVLKDLNFATTGANFLGDRGGAQPGIDYLGEYAIGYPEGYDWRYWMERDEKAMAYDTDGAHIATVTLKKSGTFRIRIESNDIAERYPMGTKSADSGNSYLFYLYHWCLRPTKNNY